MFIRSLDVLLTLGIKMKMSCKMICTRDNIRNGTCIRSHSFSTPFGFWLLVFQLYFSRHFHFISLSFFRIMFALAHAPVLLHKSSKYKISFLYLFECQKIMWATRVKVNHFVCGRKIVALARPTYIYIYM